MAKPVAFTEEEILQVRALKQLGLRDKAIAESYRVVPATVGKYTYGVIPLTPKEVYELYLAKTIEAPPLHEAREAA